MNQIGIKNANIHYQCPPEKLQTLSLENGLGEETDNHTLAINTGKFTGRSPKDRFIVKDALTQDSIWWGSVNLPFSESHFDALHHKILTHFSGKEIYVRDSFVCADERYRSSVRTITETPWASLFAYNMFIRPKQDEIPFANPDWLVLHAPSFYADPQTDGTRQANFAILNFTKRIILIGGTGYTGEMKKGIFSALNFMLPIQHNVLPMHCSANVGKNLDTAIFFGLSGTGKTTLSSDPHRNLIGDDEHGWTPDDVIFNFEGGCYAKVIDLNEEREPDIFKAIRQGALLENVKFYQGTNRVNYQDGSITENTRVSYPLEYIQHIQTPSLAKNPKNIFFLTCDAFGVLPPISKLSPGQAAYHFISGYTSKVAGTEAGVSEPQPVFSACFGAAFMPLHPTRYAQMLSDKIKSSQATVWLVNTGWIGGAYGVGSRIKLSYTRDLIAAALEGALSQSAFVQDPIFKVQIPTACKNIPAEILNPLNTWKDKKAYRTQALQVARSLRENFKQFAQQASQEILDGAPVE